MEEEIMALVDRLKNSWNAFIGRDPTPRSMVYGYSYPSRPDRVRFSRGNERSIITSILNRIAVDAASIDIKHVKLDKDGKYVKDMDSGLNNCLTLEANIDQAARAFRQDVIMSLLDEGHVCVVPTDATASIIDSSAFDIITMRTGKIVQWFPTSVRVQVYNERLGKRQEIILPKKSVSIIENPFYAIMNEPNSNLQRLIKKLALLDITDENIASGKLDLIIQLPYVIKTEARRKQAEERRRLIEAQLEGSPKYGIAYTDGTEKITQLNKPLENQLLNQVQMLQETLFAQLGITQEILNGSASEETMQNYYTRTIEPILSAITEEFLRKFITPTGRKQGQSVMFFRDPFKLVPVGTMAELADKLTRNEIMTPNEMRQKMGLKPSSDKEADDLRNRNISKSKEELEAELGQGQLNKNQNGKEGGDKDASKAKRL
jgi:hypothetical protein